MRKLISGWTEQHVPVALALVVAALVGGVATTTPSPYTFLALGAVLATAVGALFLDAFGGLVLGVAAATVVVLGVRLGGRWTPEFFVTALALVVGLIALGWLAGMVSAGIHARRDGEDEDGGATTPAYGSLGLLTAQVARARLEEEVARARSHGRPLSLVVIRVSIADRALAPPSRDAAQRAVARLVESMLRETDVPFTLGPGEFGAILPETDVAAAWDVVGPVLDAATRAAFTVREQDERRSLVDCAELHVGFSVLSEELSDAEQLLERARGAARTDAEDAAPVRHAAPGASS